MGYYPYPYTPAAAGTGTALIDGLGSKWNNTGTLYIGYGGTGTLQIYNGSSVSVGATTWVGDAYSYFAVGTGTIDFGASGGTLTTQALAASPSQLLGTGTINTQGLLTDANLTFSTPASLTQTFVFGGVAVNLNMSTPASNGVLGAGYSGTGTLTIQTPVASTTGYLGFLPGSVGTATVSGSGAWTMSSTALIGDWGTGTLNILNGGQVTSGAANIGTYSGDGTVNISGAGSTWTVSGILYIGDHANTLVPAVTGTVHITSGGQLVSNSPTAVAVGQFAGATGWVTVDGSGSSWTCTNGILVGASGRGTMTITNGATVSDTQGCSAQYPGSTGSVIISGFGSKWTNSSSLSVGNSGTGSVAILNGGTVSDAAGFIGTNSAGIGTVAIDGVASTWTSSSTLTVGNSGAGTLDISGGGAATTATNVTVGSTGVLAIDVGRGSSLKANNGAGTLTDNGTVQVVAGADVPAGNTYSPISAGTWSGSGTYQPVGGTWNSTTHVFTASTVVSNSGTGGATASIDTSVRQRILIDDTADGTSLGVSVLPASAATPLVLTAVTVTGATLSSLQGNLPAGQAVLDAWGISTTGTGYTAGQPAYLSLSLGAGYTPYQLTVAGFARSNLSVWDYNGTAWSQLPANDLTWDGTDASFTATALNGNDYAITGTPLLPGDANRDSQVDVNDLTIVLSNFGQTGCSWAQGCMDGDPSGTVDVNDLTIVLSNFGRSFGSAATAVAAVPEPSVAVLAVAGLAGFVVLAWRKRKSHGCVSRTHGPVIGANGRNIGSPLTSGSVCLVALATLSALARTPGVGWADGLIANWTLNQPTGTTSIPDNSGNGHTATLLGSDTLTSMSDKGYPSAPVGGGLYFSGQSGTDNCLSVPYSPSLGGMTCLTLSSWVYYPSETDYTNAVLNTGEELFNMWDQDGGNQSYRWGYYLPQPNDRMGFTAVGGLAGSTLEMWGSVWKTMNGNGPDYVPGTWAQWTMVYNGNALTNGYDGGETAVSTCFIYENGVLMTGGSFGIGSNGHQFTLPSPASGQAMQIAGGTNEWLGSLADLGMWNVALTSENYAGSSPGGVAGNTRGSSGGEVAALYNTPMYNNNTGSLSQYGVKAMDQLFTLFDGANPRTVAVVTTSNSQAGLAVRRRRAYARLGRRRPTGRRPVCGPTRQRR
jgi:T5SS/PEP-CTERM-associated repeat protein